MINYIKLLPFMQHNNCAPNIILLNYQDNFQLYTLVTKANSSKEYLKLQLLDCNDPTNRSLPNTSFSIFCATFLFPTFKVMLMKKSHVHVSPPLSDRGGGWGGCLQCHSPASVSQLHSVDHSSHQWTASAQTGLKHMASDSYAPRASEAPSQTDAARPWLRKAGHLATYIDMTLNYIPLFT